MPKKPRKRRRAVDFPIATTFPPSDPVAVDLLRLQAAHNDLFFLFEWVDAHLQIPGSHEAKLLAASRWSLQFRLLAATMHEALQVLDGLENGSGFPALERRLDADGRSSLARLRRVRSGQDPFGKSLLAIVRHKTAYHYDHAEFSRGLHRLLAHFGHDNRSNVLLIENAFRQEDFVFPLVDALRVEISRGLTAQHDSRKRLDTLLELVRAYGTLVESLLVAYADDRQLTTNFRRRG